MGRDDDKDENEDYESVSAMADRLKFKGRDRERYIDQHMRGLGYRMVPSYVRPDDDDDDDDRRGGSRFFPRSGHGRSNRDDDDW